MQHHEPLSRRRGPTGAGSASATRASVSAAPRRFTLPPERTLLRTRPDAAAAAGNEALLAAVRATFTRWAPFYDATHRWLPYRRISCRLTALHPGQRVLDVGCGTGLDFRHLEALVGTEGEVWGVDLVPAMVDRALDRVHRKGWTNVRVEEGDAAHLRFPDATFHAVASAYCMNIIPDYRRAVAEAWRVLRPGGRFVVLDVAARRGGVAERTTHRHPGSPWLCAVDLGHRPLDALQDTFGDIEVHWRLGGRFWVAVATR